MIFNNPIFEYVRLHRDASVIQLCRLPGSYHGVCSVKRGERLLLIRYMQQFFDDVDILNTGGFAVMSEIFDIYDAHKIINQIY